MVSCYDFLDWDISGPGLVLKHVLYLFIISVGGLVANDWNLSCLNGFDWSICSLIQSVVPGLFFGSVCSLVLSSVLGIKDRVVPGFLLLSVINRVLGGISSFCLVSVFCLRVSSIFGSDIGSVPVLFLISVFDFVVSLVAGEWNISVLGLGIVSVLNSRLPGESRVVVRSVLDLIGFCVSDLLLFLIFHLDVFVLSGDWDLSGPDFFLSLVLDSIFNLVIDDLDIVEYCFSTEFGVFMWEILCPLDGDSGGRVYECDSEFHLDKFRWVKV